MAIDRIDLGASGTIPAIPDGFLLLMGISNGVHLTAKIVPDEIDDLATRLGKKVMAENVFNNNGDFRGSTSSIIVVATLMIVVVAVAGGAH